MRIVTRAQLRPVTGTGEGFDPVVEILLKGKRKTSAKEAKYLKIKAL